MASPSEEITARSADDVTLPGTVLPNNDVTESTTTPDLQWSTKDDEQRPCTVKHRDIHVATAQSSRDQQEEDDLFNLREERNPSYVHSLANRSSSSDLVVRLTTPDYDANNQGDELAVQAGSTLGQCVQAHITAPVHFGNQKIRNNTSVYKQRVGDVARQEVHDVERQEVHHVERQEIAHVEKQEIHVTYLTHSCDDHADNSNENESWCQVYAEALPRIYDVSPEDVSRAVELLDKNRRVALCGPPGSGKSSLGHAILTHYYKRGFKVHLANELCCQCQQSFRKKKQTIILMDGGFGVVRLDSDQYYRCQDLINNTKCLLVLTAYPHLLRDMSVLENRRPLLPSSLIIEMKPRPHDPNLVFTPSATDYLPLFQHMLHDPHYGHLVAALFALSMLGRYSFESDPPELTPDLQRLGFHSVDHYQLKQLAYNFRGSILPERGPGFVSRVLYDAAGLALGRLHSLSVLLQVCDVTFLVQHVQTSGESHNSVILLVEDRSILMQRIYEFIVDGQMAILCQHPSLTCPGFLKDFEDFLTSHKNYMQRVVSAVDTEYGLPLLYWSVWSISTHLTHWCLTVTLEQVRESQALPLNLVSAVVAVLLTETDIDTRLKAKQLLIRFKSLATTLKVIELPFPSILFTPERKAKVSGVKTRLRTTSMCYLDDSSMHIPATLLSVTVTKNAVSVELPSQHWHLALRLLADREVDETDLDGNTLLHIAADKINLEAITLAVKSGASLAKKNNKGLTPYHLAHRQLQKRGNNDLPAAIPHGDDTAIKSCLCYGSGVHVKDDDGRTGLIVACKHGQISVADLLIQLGADVHAATDDEETALHYACQCDSPSASVNITRLLLDAGVDVNAGDRWGTTPLHYASRSGHTETVTLLFDRGADVNARDKWGRTALHVASGRGCTETLTLLIDHGADLNAKDKSDRTPFHYAYTNKGPGIIITLLMEAGVKTGRVHQAVVRGDVDALMNLLQQGADVNQHDTSMGCSPLHAACLMGRTDTVTCLTQQGAKMDVGDDTKRTPLHYACDGGQTQVARQLIHRGAEVNVRDKYLSTPLHEAAAKGNTEITRCLIEHGAEVDAENDDAVTPLHKACMSSEAHEATVLFLLQHGANVNSVSEGKETPLHTACENGHTQTALFLLKHGANVNAVSWLCGTPLHAACKNGHTQTAQFLLKNGANVNTVSECRETPLHTACWNGHTQTAQFLLQNGANVNAQSRFNVTPLHKACEESHIQTVQVLLQHGANVNSEGKETPLYTACKNGHTQTALCLLQRGANVNAVSKWNKTPLYTACENGHTQTAQCLLQRGANVNAESKWNKTPLYTACENGHTEIALFLLQHGANVNSVSEGKETPLYTACKNGHTQTALCLLQRGANVNAVSKYKKTPLHTACYQGHTQIVECLLQNGANVNAVSDWYGTPLHTACDQGHTQIVECLLQNGAK